MKRTISVLCLLVLLFLLTQSALAMPSAAYQITWTNRLSGSGGSASSTSFKLDLTVGQTVQKASSNASYQVQMGYWGGIYSTRFFLPVVKNN